MHYEFKRLKNRIFGLLFFIAVASPFPASAQSNEPSVEDTLAWIASVLGHGSASASQIEPNGDICFKSFYKDSKIPNETGGNRNFEKMYYFTSGMEYKKSQYGDYNIYMRSEVKGTYVYNESSIRRVKGYKAGRDRFYFKLSDLSAVRGLGKNSYGCWAVELSGNREKFTIDDGYNVNTREHEKSYESSARIYFSNSNMAERVTKAFSHLIDSKETTEPF